MYGSEISSAASQLQHPDYGLGLVCIHSLDGYLLSVSPAGAKALGYEPDEMVGRAMRDFLPQDVRHELSAYLDHIRQQGKASGLMRVVTKSGDERILTYSNVCRYEGGAPVYVLGHAADITELKKAEQQLRAAEQKFRWLLQCSSDVVAIVDAHAAIQYVSPAIHKALAYLPQQVVGRSVFDYVHPDDVAAAQLQFGAALKKPGYAIPFELRVRKSDGSYVPFDVTANNLLQTPSVGGVVLSAKDVSGRKLVERDLKIQKEELEKRERQRAAELAAANRKLLAEIQERQHTEGALRESQSLVRAALESTVDGILVVDLNGKIVSFNRRFIEMWGIPQAILDRQSDLEALNFVAGQVKSPAEFVSKINLLYASPEQSSYDTVEFKDGRVFERYSQPQRIGGNIVGRVWSFHDVTERKRLEEHLRQAQKMEAIGRLAGGIAHDFNNLLMIIMGHCRQLKDCQEVANPVRNGTQQIFEAAEKAASLTRQLLAFSRRQVLAPRVLDVNVVLADLSGMLRRLIGEDIEFAITHSETPSYVAADPAQLDQVIVNLVVNGRDAMPEGGVLRINARPADLKEPRTRGTASVPAGKYVLITVTDTGSGMSEEILSRIFEPFFTTKELGQGTGLGLATVYGIVRQSDGYILVESEIGGGTTFDIYLPRLDAPAIEIPAQDANVACCRGSETILLVEDEEGIRTLTRTFLEQQGYTVLEAANGADALTLAKNYSRSIHLLLTDVVMPGIRGTDLAKAFLNFRPASQVLYISGYPEQEITHPGAALLQKPFPMEELGAKIRQVIEKRGAAAV